MLDNLTQRLARVMKTLRGEARLTEENIADALREYDVCGRWGGEEFLILMPETPMDFALQIAQRVAQSIKNIRLEFLDSAISASFGLSVYRLGEAFSETLNRADAALLRAKALGRDRIESAA